MVNLLNSDNVAQYEASYGIGIADHLYPNENLVRLVKWFFKGGKVLDYGFGSGENLIHLLKSGYMCSAVEVSLNAKTLVENKLKEYPQFDGKVDLHILEEGQEHLPFEDDTFDYIVSNQVVYFLASEQKIVHLLSEFKRVLRSNGRLIITMMSRLNHFCFKGIEIEPNIYKYEDKGNDYIRYVYILRDEGHARDLFSLFEINEIGWFENYYCGVAGHHYVILASNNPK